MSPGEWIAAAGTAVGAAAAAFFAGRKREPDADRSTHIPPPPHAGSLIDKDLAALRADVAALRTSVTALEAERNKRDEEKAEEDQRRARQALTAAVREMTAELRGKRGGKADGDEKRESGS